MIFSNILLSLAVAALVSAAPTPATNTTEPPSYPTDGPLPHTLPGVDVSRVVSLDNDIYPIGISNGTHYFIYLVNATSLAAQEQAHVADAAPAKRDAAPGWTWWQPYPGEPAWKKRDAVASPDAAPEAAAAPGWTWWQPYPGEPAWKKAKRDAVAAPEADAAPGWTWWQPYPGEPAWKKRDAVAAPEADAAAAPRWNWWQPYPGEPAWKKTKRDASAAPGWTWWQPYPGEPAW